MSYLKHFAKPFSKGKSDAIVRQLAEVIAARTSHPTTSYLDPLTSDRWPGALLPVDYQNPDIADVAARRQYNAFFEKNHSIGSMSKDEREAATFQTWLAAEQKCKETNARFKFPLLGISPRRHALIHRVCRKISEILGPCPSLSELQFGFGPGSNIGISRLTSVRRKLSACPTVTANAAGLLNHLQASHPHWNFASPVIAKGRLTFVQKSATKDRPIVVEPIMNTYIQKGIGEYMRSRLKRAGVNLNSQETNRDFARFGSKTGLVATIDLSSASDTIAKAVVAELIPYDWLSLLESCRTPEVTYKSVCYRLEKFSSMGNGYTFELETVIFYAILRAVCIRGDFTNAYGDDLIVPTRSYEDVVDALEFFGFSVNLEKSFSSGCFRESCGKDFLKGVDIRPIYLKGRISYKELFRLHNFFKRNYDEEMVEVIRQHIPKQLQQITGPDGFGDGHLLGAVVPIRRGRKSGWALLGFVTLQAKPRMTYEPMLGDHAAILYAQSCRVSNNRLDPEPSDSLLSDSLWAERGGGMYRKVKVYTWAL